MLPNKRALALVVLTLLFTQALPVANAQVQGVDLEVISVTPREPPVVGKTVTVDVVVRNNGNQASTSPFEVFISSRGSCLDAGDNPQTTPTTNEPNPQQGCVRRFLTGSIGADGRTATLFFDWSPSGTQRGEIPIRSEIRGTQTATGGISDPDDYAGNNVKDHSPIFVIYAEVEAAPDREVAPHTGAKLNDPWQAGDIKEPCPTDPSVLIRTACLAKPGQVLKFNYHVYNKGNKQDVMVPAFQNLDDLEERGWSFRFSDARLAVPATPDPANLGVIIGVPEYAEAGDSISVGNERNRTLRVSSTNDEREDTSASGDPLLPSILVDRVYGLNLTENGTLRVVNATQYAVFYLTLNNTGNADDTYRIRVLEGTGSINGSWELPPDQLVTLEPREVRMVEVRFKAPLNATKGQHATNVTIQSVNDPDGTTFRTLRLTADLFQHYNVKGNIPTSLVTRLPADTASFTVRVQNDGNWYDNVTLQLAPLPFGWTGGLSQNIVMVPPFSHRDVYLNVTPPANATKNQEASFYVNLTSSGPLTGQRARDGPAYATVRVLPGSNIQTAMIAADDGFVDPGTIASWTFRVTNVGNNADVFKVELDSQDDTWRVASTLPEVALQPLRSADVTVTLEAPAGAAVGDVNDLKVTLRSTEDSRKTRTLTFTSRISGPDLRVEEARVSPSSVYAGDEVGIAVTLLNDGNIAPTRNATLHVFFEKDGGQTEIGSREIAPNRLRAGARITELFTWNDTTPHEGEGTLVVVVDPDGEIAEIDEGDASNRVSRALVLRTAGAIDIARAQGLSGRPGELVSYTEPPSLFTVTYTGNQPSEPVSVLIESENGWFRQERAIELLRGTPMSFPVELEVPRVPGVAQDRLTITVKPTLRPSESHAATVVTTIIDDVPPVVSGLTVQPSTVVFGEDVRFVAQVADATGLRSVKLVVVSPDDRSQTIDLLAGEGDTWVATKAFSDAGVYRVYVEATDNSATPNRADSRATLVDFRVDPGSAPSITLAEGQSATIRTGALVKLNVSDPLGVGRVTYSIRGLEYELAFPYQIDTSNFPDGSVEVTVSAENIYGVRTTERIQLEVDNAPPGIRRVTLSPESPKVNEDATLLIETDENVHAVDVVIKRDGQVLETRAATKERDGRFTLLLNAGEGDYVLDVTARDAAGNAQIESGAVVFSAKPASFVPAPGLALAAAAFVLACLLARRRA